MECLVSCGAAERNAFIAGGLVFLVCMGVSFYLHTGRDSWWEIAMYGAMLGVVVGGFTIILWFAVDAAPVEVYLFMGATALAALLGRAMRVITHRKRPEDDQFMRPATSPSSARPPTRPTRCI